MSDDVPEPASAEDVEAARRRVFEGLPPEMQANPEIRARFGLGDAVEVLARPIASMFGIKKCGGCKKRQQKLNEIGDKAAAGVRRVFGRNTG